MNQDHDPVALLRTTVNMALETAEVDGIAAYEQIAVVATALAQLVAGSVHGDVEFETLLANALRALDRAAREERSDIRYRRAVEAFVGQWLN